MGDDALVVEMSEPGAAGRAFPQDSGPRSRLDDRRRQELLSLEIPPGRRTRPHGLPIRPAHGHRPIRVLASPCPLGDRKGRRQPCEFAQALADMAEIDPRLQPLDEPEDVALGVAHGVPPAAAAVADDQDLALPAAILQAELRALLPVEPPGRRRALEHDGAMHLVAQVRRFRGRSWSLLPFGCRSWAVWPWAGPRPCPSRRPRGGRAARARGTRGSLRRTLVGAAGASGSHPSLPRSSGRGSRAMARTGNPRRTA